MGGVKPDPRAQHQSLLAYTLQLVLWYGGTPPLLLKHRTGGGGPLSYTAKTERHCHSYTQISEKYSELSALLTCLPTCLPPRTDGGVIFIFIFLIYYILQATEWTPPEPEVAVVAVLSTAPPPLPPSF